MAATDEGGPESAVPEDPSGSQPIPAQSAPNVSGNGGLVQLEPPQQLLRQLLPDSAAARADFKCECWSDSSEYDASIAEAQASSGHAWTSRSAARMGSRDAGSDATGSSTSSSLRWSNVAGEPRTSDMFLMTPIEGDSTFKGSPGPTEVGERERSNKRAGRGALATARKTRLHFFSKLFSRDMALRIVQCTNNYVEYLHRKPRPHHIARNVFWPPLWASKWQELTEERVMTWIAVLLYRVLHPTDGDEEELWSKHWFWYRPGIHQFMTYWEFKVIQTAIHFQDRHEAAENAPEADGPLPSLPKIGILLDMFRTNCRRHYLPSELISLDEVLLPLNVCDGRGAAVSTRGAIRVSAVVEKGRLSEYLWDFEVARDIQHRASAPHLRGGDRRVRLVRGLPAEHRNHKVTVPSSVISPHLFRQIREAGHCGCVLTCAAEPGSDERSARRVGIGERAACPRWFDAVFWFILDQAVRNALHLWLQYNDHRTSVGPAAALAHPAGEAEPEEGEGAEGSGEVDEAAAREDPVNTPPLDHVGVFREFVAGLSEELLEAYGALPTVRPSATSAALAASASGVAPALSFVAGSQAPPAGDAAGGAGGGGPQREDSERPRKKHRALQILSSAARLTQGHFIRRSTQQRNCALCYHTHPSKAGEKQVKFWCPWCKLHLHVECFEEWHTKKHPQSPLTAPSAAQPRAPLAPSGSSMLGGASNSSSRSAPTGSLQPSHAPTPPDGSVLPAVELGEHAAAPPPPAPSSANA